MKLLVTKFCIAATLHIGGRSSIGNLRTRHAVVTGTFLSHEQVYLYRLKIRRFGKCFWPSLETVSFSHIYSGLNSDAVSSTKGLRRRITELVRIRNEATATQFGVVSQHLL
jgi:hypothetical protein